VNIFNSRQRSCERQLNLLWRHFDLRAPADVTTVGRV